MAFPVAAVISGALSIGQGIFGASQASSSNARAKRAAEAAERKAKKIAKNVNEYNLRAFEVDQQNYFNQRDYEFQIATQNWERGKEIQDFEFSQLMRQYAKSVGIYEQQLTFNDLAAETAYANESAALAGLFTQQAFAREDQMMGLQRALTEISLNRRTTDLEMQSVINKGTFGITAIQENLKEYTKQTDFKKQSALVDALQAQGKNELRQAGGSARKGAQSTMAGFYRGMTELSSALSGKQRQAALQVAELGLETSLLTKKLEIQAESLDNAAMSAIADAQFNMRVLDADIASAVAQSERNMQQISLQKYGADLNAAANLMIKPEQLPYAPAPTLAPERVFIEPMKVRPGAVAQPVQQNVWGPLISGVTQGISSGISIYTDMYKNQGQNTLGSIFGSNNFPSSVPSYLNTPVFGTNG
jgi:hypothetical protein